MAQDELIAAGAPPDVNPMGQALPLFACMQISQDNADGVPCVPLFMSAAECKQRATMLSAGSSPEIVCYPLIAVVEELIEADGKPKFVFVAPGGSEQYVRPSFLDQL